MTSHEPDAAPGTTPGTVPTTAYESARTQGDAALRSGLLDVAGRVLERDGSEGLTMRRLADEAGCSTTVWYRLYEGKQGVVKGLYREGFDRLRARMAAAPSGASPLQHLGALAHAYRGFALDEPAYYRVMFARPVPQFAPSPDDVAHGRHSLRVLVDAVAAAQAAGELGGDDPEGAADLLWTAAHGAVSLELAGHLQAGQAEHVFSALTAAAGRSLEPPPARHGP